MLIGMWAKIVAVLPELLNWFFKITMAVEPSGKEKRGFYFFFIQSFGNKATAFTKFIPCKYQCDILFCAIAPDNSAPVVTKASCAGGYRFFGLLSASFAANK